MKPPGALADNAAHYSKLMASVHWLTALLVAVAYVISEGRAVLGVNRAEVLTIQGSPGWCRINLARSASWHDTDV